MERHVCNDHFFRSSSLSQSCRLAIEPLEGPALSRAAMSSIQPVGFRMVWVLAHFFTLDHLREVFDAGFASSALWLLVWPSILGLRSTPVSVPTSLVMAAAAVDTLRFRSILALWTIWLPVLGRIWGFLCWFGWLVVFGSLFGSVGLLASLAGCIGFDGLSASLHGFPVWLYLLKVDHL